MVVWGVVSSEIEQVIEFFGSRHEAERTLAEVLLDEPEWVEAFRIERIEVGTASNGPAFDRTIVPTTADALARCLPRCLPQPD
jgi:hypothetical protein